jgi:hypothetical protein
MGSALGLVAIAVAGFFAWKAFAVAMVFSDWIDWQNAHKCEWETIKSIPSPDGSKTAWSLLMGCGATVGFATKVCLIANTSPQSFDDCAPILFVGGKYEIVQSWTDNRTLVLELPTNERVIDQVDERDGVTIKYVTP